MNTPLEIGKIAHLTNSADGVEIWHIIYNAGTKAMKYVTFTYVPYNAVGDRVYCSIKKTAEVVCRLTGPIEPGEESRLSWENLWYNPTVSRIELLNVKIEYMDDTFEFFEGKDLTSTESPESSYKKMCEEKATKNKRLAELKKPYYSFAILGCLKKAKSDEELKFHVNQGLWLLILEILGILLCLAVPILFVIGYGLIVVAIVFSVIGVNNVNKNIKKELPLVGKIKFLK